MKNYCTTTVKLLSTSNEINLSNATIHFKIVRQSVPSFSATQPKCHFGVEVDFKPSFNTRQEYAEFRKSWKNLYRDITRGIRGIRPIVNLSYQNRSMGEAMYYIGLYSMTCHNLYNALFFWRMQAKALLAALVQAKKIAREQRERGGQPTNCTHCLHPMDDCQCSDFDVHPEMGAK